jgi:hypothetical protein
MLTSYEPMKGNETSKLNGSNYHAWSEETMILLQEKGLSRFIEYLSFEAWAKETIEKEELQIEYENEVERLDKKIDKAEDEYEKDSSKDRTKTSNAVEKAYSDIRAYKKEFHAERSRWGAEKKKQEEHWSREEEMFGGLLKS